MSLQAGSVGGGSRGGGDVCAQTGTCGFADSGASAGACGGGARGGCACTGACGGGARGGCACTGACGGGARGGVIVGGDVVVSVSCFCFSSYLVLSSRVG